VALSDRISKREERHSDAALWQGAKFLGRALLGAVIRSVTVGFELEQVRKYIREQEAAMVRGSF